MAKEKREPTELDWQGFSSISLKERAQCLYYYLQKGYVMEEAGHFSLR